jgi:hypothetical protein
MMGSVLRKLAEVPLILRLGLAGLFIYHGSCDIFG